VAEQIGIAGEPNPTEERVIGDETEERVARIRESDTTVTTLGLREI